MCVAESRLGMKKVSHEEREREGRVRDFLLDEKRTVVSGENDTCLSLSGT